MKTFIVLPDELWGELKHSIPARQRNRFVAEAVERQLRSLKFKKTPASALRSTAVVKKFSTGIPDPPPAPC